MMYDVSEIFGPTIQGEGLHSGRTCIFLRLSGCNLWRKADTPSVTCPWCDTPQLHNRTPHTTLEILNKLADLQTVAPFAGLVISGGEPFLQLQDTLLEECAEMFPWIDIETNGSVLPNMTDDRPYWASRGGNVFISCSPKLRRLSQVVVKPSWWKILIPDKINLFKELLQKGVPRHSIYLQPVEPLDKGETINSPQYHKNMEQCVQIALVEGCNVCVQLHKYLHLK